MRPDRHQDKPHQFDAYLDGLLSEPEQASFAQLVAQTPDLQAAVKRQAHVNEALKRHAAPPDPKDVLAAITSRLPAAEAGQSQGAFPISRRWGMTTTVKQRVAVAALLILSVLAAWRIWSFYQPAPWHGYPNRPRQSIHVAYNDIVEKGFRPDWLCKTEEEFVSTFELRLGQRLALATPPEGTSATGWVYVYVISPSTIALLGKVDSAKVLIFVDHASADPGQMVPPESGLNLYRRELAGLVLYELSPLDRSHFLDLFYVPDERAP